MMYSHESRLMNFWIQLFKLAINRKKTREDYFEFQEFQANHVIRDIKKILPLSASASVIDYGCGNGGYSYVLAREFKDVVCVDYFIDPVREKFTKIDNARFESADLITYRGDPKDFLFCASVVEHIPLEKQSLFIKNIGKNIRKNGYLYLSFPPFKSVIGGHLCAPFHYLPDRMAFYLTKKIKKYNISSFETMYGSWGVFKTSIQDVEKWLLANAFKIIQIKPRYLPSSCSKIISKNNFLNWHAEFYCQNL